MHQLVKERGFAEAEPVARIGKGGGEEGDARHLLPGLRESLETRHSPFLWRQARNAVGQAGGRAFGLGHREQAELKEAVARRRRQKIRVAAAGVQHHPLGVARGERDQPVFQLERAQRIQSSRSVTSMSTSTLTGTSIS